jgi:hypothetical protein
MAPNGVFPTGLALVEAKFIRETGPPLNPDFSDKVVGGLEDLCLDDDLPLFPLILLLLLILILARLLGFPLFLFGVLAILQFIAHLSRGHDGERVPLLPLDHSRDGQDRVQGLFPGDFFHGYRDIALDVVAGNDVDAAFFRKQLQDALDAGFLKIEGYQPAGR